MQIEDTFVIEGRGLVATGRVERGTLNKMDEVEIEDPEGKIIKRSVAIDIENFKKLLDKAVVGDNVGVLLKGVKKGDVERGWWMAAPGTGPKP